MDNAAFRCRRHTLAFITFFLLVAAPAAAGRDAAYHLLEPRAVSEGSAAPGLVRVRGIYFPYGDYRELIRGVVVLGGYALRVEGEIFDWRPPAGRYIDCWGELLLDGTGYMLRFHNGRKSSEPGRTPRPTPLLAAGLAVELRLKTAHTGSQPFPLASGRTEDGIVFILPPSYAGPWGVTCLRGIAEPLGQGWSLREVQPCAE